MNAFNFLLGLILAVAVGWAFHDRSRYEGNLKFHRLKPGRKTYLTEPLLLPLFLVMLVVTVIAKSGTSQTLIRLAAACTVLFLYIGLYFALLLCLLPLLRRFISARACAALWLLPNLLYLTMALGGAGMNPLITITLPRQWLSLLIGLWAAGFAGVLLWQIISHLRYRHFLLQGSEPVIREEILAQWNYEQGRHEIKKNIPLLQSPLTATPVTIGCYEQTMRLVLPPQSYDKKELELIFRHELRHIQRCDTRVKAFLGFCTAMCWFNPLMWVARRRIAEDLELSCDEAVLEGSNETTRKQYAELLLKTAGDGRGYTTCLSAAANSLRYRLKNVMMPRKRFPGAVVVGAAMLALLMGAGSIALAGSGSSVKELVFDKAPQGIAIDSITTYNWPGDLRGFRSVYGWEEAALTDYLAALQVKQVYAGNYPEGSQHRIYVDYTETVAGEAVSFTRLELGGGLLRANIPYDEFGNITYILEDEIDWAYVDSLLDFDAADPDPAPWPPEMTMYFNEEISGKELMHASKRILSISSGGQAQEVDEFRNDISAGGVVGVIPPQVKFYFSYEPMDGYKVKVENWDHTESYYVSSEELTDDTLPLAPYSAHYTVSGRFTTVRETVYEMEFFFDILLRPDDE